MLKKILLLFLMGIVAYSLTHYQEEKAHKLINISRSTYFIKNPSSNICDQCYPELKVSKISHDDQYLYIIGYDATINSVIVAFRGSDNTLNWITDARIFKRKYDGQGCKGCSIHTGFKKAYASVKDIGLENDIQNEFKNHPGAKVLFTGHSLGGAMANLAAIKFHERHSAQNPEIELYTYGQPRVGDKDYAEYHASKIPKNYRIIHSKDMVPHKPAHIIGYYHVGYELWYDNGMASLINSCEAESDACSNSLDTKAYAFKPDHSSENYIKINPQKQ